MYIQDKQCSGRYRFGNLNLNPQAFDYNINKKLKNYPQGLKVE